MLISTLRSDGHGHATARFNPSTGLMLISTWLPIVYPGIVASFNPSTGLMLISTAGSVPRQLGHSQFQSLDWVDVDFDMPVPGKTYLTCTCFNPSTGLMLISTSQQTDQPDRRDTFQSLDWVDVDFDVVPTHKTAAITMFQSLDWVDVDFDQEQLNSHRATVYRFNPSTGLMLISTWRRPWSRPKSPSFNPSTGLMLISTPPGRAAPRRWRCFNPSTGLMLISTVRSLSRFVSLVSLFQSLDWVDVDFDNRPHCLAHSRSRVSIPRLG